MYPENEEEIVGAAAEHIEEASIADGLEKEAKPQPTEAEGVPGVEPGMGTEADAVNAAIEHIEEASIADGRTK